MPFNTTRQWGHHTIVANSIFIQNHIFVGNCTFFGKPHFCYKLFFVLDIVNFKWTIYNNTLSVNIPPENYATKFSQFQKYFFL